MKADGDFYNPYRTQENIIEKDRITGTIFAEKYDGEEHSKALKSLLSIKSDNLDIVIDPKSIPQGNNNKFVNYLSYTFFMPTSNVGYLLLTDANNTRYHIP